MAKTLFRLLTAVAALQGCRATIPGEREERDKARAEGRAYEVPFQDRKVSEPPPDAPLEVLLQRVLASNPEIERLFFEYAAALERVAQEASPEQPELRLELMFGTGMPNPVDIFVEQMVPGSGKLELRGRVALAEAQAAFFHYQHRYFEVQAEFLTAYAEAYARSEAVRIGELDLALLRSFQDLVAAKLRAGKAHQSELLRAQLETEKIENELEMRRAGLRTTLADLNAKLARDPKAPLEPPKTLEILPLRYSDAEILGVASTRYLELKMLAAEVKGREDALELARRQFVPDFKFSLGVESLFDPFLGTNVTLPVRRERIEAAIREAEARLRAAREAVRSREYSFAQQIVALLIVIRDADRQMGLFEKSLIPKAEAALASTRSLYTAGSAKYLDAIEAQRTVLELQLGLARLRAERGKAVADLLVCCAYDVNLLDKEGKP